MQALQLLSIYVYYIGMFSIAGILIGKNYPGWALIFLLLLVPQNIEIKIIEPTTHKE